MAFKYPPTAKAFLLIYFSQKCSKSQKYCPKIAREFVSQLFVHIVKVAAYGKTNGKTNGRDKKGHKKINNKSGQSILINKSLL